MGSGAVYLSSCLQGALQQLRGRTPRAVGGGRRDKEVWKSFQRVGGKHGHAVCPSRLPTPTHTPTFTLGHFPPTAHIPLPHHCLIEQLEEAAVSDSHLSLVTFAMETPGPVARGAGQRFASGLHALLAPTPPTPSVLTVPWETSALCPKALPLPGPRSCGQAVGSQKAGSWRN